MFGRPTHEVIRDSLIFLFLGLVAVGNFGNGDNAAGVIGVILFVPWMGLLFERWLYP